jgi:hypothetical protein
MEKGNGNGEIASQIATTPYVPPTMLLQPYVPPPMPLQKLEEMVFILHSHLPS